MSLAHDPDIETAAPPRARELDRSRVPERDSRSGAEARADFVQGSIPGTVPAAWRAVAGAGRRGGHPGLRGSVFRLQSEAGNAAVAGLVGARADARSTRRVGSTLLHSGDADVPGSEPGPAVPPETDAPTPLDNDAAAPAPTSSFTKVGPPTKSGYTVSGTLREAANAVAARPEAGATITAPSLNPDLRIAGGWPAHVQVTVTQAVVLPEWDGKASATQNQRNEWDRFKAAITAHENGHVAVDKTSYANAHGKIRAKKTRAEASTEFDTIATQDDTDNDTFDTTTDHGRNAGTNINPNIDEVTKVP